MLRIVLPGAVPTAIPAVDIVPAADIGAIPLLMFVLRLKLLLTLTFMSLRPQPAPYPQPPPCRPMAMPTPKLIAAVATMVWLTAVADRRSADKGKPAGRDNHGL